MKKLELSDEKALELYKNADPIFRSLLEENWSKEFFNQDITDRVKSVKDAFKIANINYENFIQDLKNSIFRKDEIGKRKLEIIAKVLNEGWKPNWKDSNEEKWYPWFEYKDGVGGFVFSDAIYGSARTYANLGSRLYFRTLKLAEYAGRTFIEEYNQMLDPHFK